MRACRWVGALAIVIAVALGVSAYGQQGTAKPEWKAFDSIDTPFWQKMETSTTQNMKVQGMDVQQKQTQAFYVKWTPKKKEGNTWKVDYEIVGVDMDIQIGGNKIEYKSSAKDKAPNNPLTDFFNALLGSQLTLTIVRDDKDGMRVTEVEGLSKFVDKLSAANEQLRSLLKTILSPDAVKQMSNPTFAAFPPSDKAWTDGKWSYPVTLNMGPIGSYETTYEFTVNPKDKSIVDVGGTMKYKAPEGKDAGGLPFTIKGGGKSKLEADSIKGSVTLDSNKGRVAKSKIEMDIKGNLTIDIAGMETPVELVQKQVSTVETMDADPFKK